MKYGEYMQLFTYCRTIVVGMLFLCSTIVWAIFKEKIIGLTTLLF